MEQDKKIIAAIAAVSSYLEEEQAALALQSMAPGMPAKQTPIDIPSAWGLNGRQSMMQMRNLMQMRTFNRSKI